MTGLEFEIRGFRSDDVTSVLALWELCGLAVPQNDPAKDIARKSKVNPEWFLVGEAAGQLVATCMAGYEGHRGWINYLAVHPGFRRRGIASAMMEEAERRLLAAGCPKINLQVRSTNGDVIAFYERVGYRIDPVVSLGKRLEQDAPSS
jgi:ribosomal protein S18 acetylase RimI-like enzyme